MVIGLREREGVILRQDDDDGRAVGGQAEKQITAFRASCCEQPEPEQGKLLN